MSDRTTQPIPGMDEYRTTIDELHFSDEAKTRMAARLAEAASKEQPMSPHAAPKAACRKRRLPLAAIAAGIAIVLGLGGIAYATGGLVSINQFVGHLFGADEAKVEIANKIGRPIGVAQSVNGVTISADAIIGDQKNVAVVFSISKDDGTAFEGIEQMDNGMYAMGFSEFIDISFPPLAAWGATGSSYFYDADPTDNAIQLVETRSYNVEDEDFSIVGRTMTATFTDLKYFGGPNEEIPENPPVIAEGTWKLTFPLMYEDATISLPAGQSFDLNGLSATFNSIRISPIALNLTYTADHETVWVDAPSGKEPEENSALADRLLGLGTITLTMRDGSTVEIETLGEGSIDPDGGLTHCTSNIFFDRIVDLDEVARITICSTTIEL